MRELAPAHEPAAFGSHSHSEPIVRIWHTYTSACVSIRVVERGSSRVKYHWIPLTRVCLKLMTHAICAANSSCEGVCVCVRLLEEGLGETGERVEVRGVEVTRLVEACTSFYRSQRQYPSATARKSSKRV